MAEHVIIDGNNLLHAMYEHAPLPNVGRETLVKIVERWAKRGGDEVTLVFDGPVPRGGLAQQLNSTRLEVRFSAAQTADDVIVAMIGKVRNAGSVRIVTSDKAIRHEAKYRRCRHATSEAFVTELFPRTDADADAPPSDGEKPKKLSPDEARKWLETFGYDAEPDEPFDGFDAMRS